MYNRTINKQNRFILVTHVQTLYFEGIQVIPIDVQIHLSNGIPGFSIVGLADKAVSESRERIRSALLSFGLAFPPKRITVNLSPANIRKEGTHYDLPIALGLLRALDAFTEDLNDYIVIGELSLDGSLVPIYGALSCALYALRYHKKLICPQACGGEAAWAGDLEIIAPTHLIDLMNHFKGTQVLSPPKGEVQQNPSKIGDFCEIKGQETAKRALEIAAAGGHNLLMIGPPGVGKSLLASRFADLLPPLSPQESLELTMIHSLVQKGMGKLIRYRPFRSPHHSASMASLVGGGIKGGPGEISLAHGGVLFLDECAEFSRIALDALRQPLENGEVTISRANAHTTYPAHFQLIAAMNPCLCGYLGQKGKECRQAPICGEKYLKRLTGPFLDRIDLTIEVPPINIKNIISSSMGEKSEQLSARVLKARNIQQDRYGEDMSLWATNARAKSANLEKDLKCCDEAKNLLFLATEKFSFSMRRYSRMLRIARTISDLENANSIERVHMAEALSYCLR